MTTHAVTPAAAGRPAAPAAPARRVSLAGRIRARLEARNAPGISRYNEPPLIITSTSRSYGIPRV